MQEMLTAKSFADIHFPQRIKLIKNLRYVSFIINDIVLLGSVIICIAWVTGFPALKIFLFKQLDIIPSSAILFMLSGLTLFFGAVRHTTNTSDTTKEKYPWWNTWVPITLAAITSILGLVNLFNFTNTLSIIQMSPIDGFCFLLIGFSLIPPFTRIPHRFHITQLFVFIVSGLSMLLALENLYQLFSSLPKQHILLMTMSLALTFAFFCFGILLRWSNRGFFGNFTLDSTGSRFAFRIFLINLVAAPLISLIIIIASQRIYLNMYQLISIIVILFAFVSSLLIWVNVKFLYKYELEHLLMRESLRAHNIDLTKEEETLRQKMTEVEEEKQSYAKKLTTQEAWRNAAEASA